MVRTSKLSATALLTLLLLQPAPVRADSKTSTLRVQATVTANCTIDAGTPLNFGNIDVSSSNFTASASTTISVACTKSAGTTSYAIYMRSSTNGWKMKNAGGESLSYTLTDENNNRWDETHPYSYQSQGKAAKSITVKGAITPDDYDVTVGSYSDTVTAEIQF